MEQVKRTSRISERSEPGQDGAGAILRRHADWPTIEPAPERRSVRVQFVNGGIYTGPPGTPMEAFAWQATEDRDPPPFPIAVLLEGRLRELSTPVTKDVSAEIVGLSHMDGARIYRRSLTLLLLAAIQRRFPEAQTSIEHSLPFGAYYCTLSARAAFSVEELAGIEEEMARLVEEDLPITSRRVPLQEVVDFFQGSGDESKVKLLAHRSKEDLAMYTLDGIQNYFHGYMVPSTGYLRWFGLAQYGDGFILRFPRRRDSRNLMPIQPSGPLVQTFQEYRQWMERMELQNLGSLNNSVVDGHIAEIILISEALHERRIANIASTIAASYRSNTIGAADQPAAQGNHDGGTSAERREPIRVVLIAGPSSSGKTTFAKRLSVQLLSNGIRPYALSLDNYFIDREKTPLDEHGNYDFESLHALDLPLFNEQLVALLGGEEVTLPTYNFKTGRSEVGEKARLEPNHVLIVEGIHGLNPELTQALDDNCTLRVYVSIVAHLNLDRHNRVSTSDVRLLRRIARDQQHRGYSASDTIENWPQVRRGEERYIFPFQGNADIVFNSALLYELCVLKPIVEPLLLQIEWDMPAYVEARRLLALLRWVRPVNAELVPDNSIIREFVGGSILRRLSLL